MINIESLKKYVGIIRRRIYGTCHKNLYDNRFYL